MSKTVGVMLSGCGVFDGSEIYEAVFTALFLDRAGAKVRFIAPDIDQMHVIDHISGDPVEGESRNVLREAARIARGEVRSAKTVHTKEFDALIFPGGFGAAKNLSSFATDGPDCEVNTEAQRLIDETLQAGKPLGFCCIAPAMAAKAIGDGVELTIGNNEEVAEAMEKMGAKHIECSVDDIHVDEKKKVVSTPAYMYGDAPYAAVADGIEKLVKKVLELA